MTYLNYFNSLNKIFSNIVPSRDHHLIEDYVQEGMIFILKILRKYPGKTLNMSYLRSVATKVCVDNLRSKSSNIKYFCTNCKRFFPRKEKAVACCEGIKREHEYVLFGVSKYETHINILSTPEYKDYEMSMTNSPESIFSERQVMDIYCSYLNEQEVEIIYYLIDGFKKKTICEIMNIKMGKLVKMIRYFRMLAAFLFSRGIL